MYTYTYKQGFLTIDAVEPGKIHRPVAFLQGDDAVELDARLSLLAAYQQQKILATYDY